MPDFTFADVMQFFDRRPREFALCQAFVRQVSDGELLDNKLFGWVKEVAAFTAVK